MKITCIGGGTGLSTLMAAWSRIGFKPTAIVATTDNGGCSGRLRTLGAPIPWGDIRKVLVALSSNEPLNKIIEHRFKQLGGFSGHNFGNLMLEVFYQQHGNTLHAIQRLAALLGVENRVIPMTESSVDLVALNNNGRLVRGEVQIDAMPTMPVNVMLDRLVCATEDAVTAIKTADVLCIGPGSLITSVLPTLLLPEVQTAIVDHKGLKLFIHNCYRENSPVGALDEISALDWLKRQTSAELINAQLANDRIIIKNASFALPGHIQNTCAPKNAKHDTVILAQRIALTICLSNAYYFRFQRNSSLSNLSRILFNGAVKQVVK